MNSLIRSMLRPATTGIDLPMPWKSLADKNIKFRRGELTLIAARPGSLKSTTLYNYLLQSQVTALVFSADTKDNTVITRLATTATNHKKINGSGTWKAFSTQDINDLRATDPHSLIKAMHQGDKVMWCFDQEPSAQTFKDWLDAYAEVHGEYPDVIAVDNLMDVDSNHPDEFGGLRETMKMLKMLAAETGSAVIVLHHVAESSKFDPENDPEAGAPARRDITGKVSHGSSLVLTLHYDRDEDEYGTGRLRIAPVKNREGEDDPSGRTFIPLEANPRYQLIVDPSEDMRLPDSIVPANKRFRDAPVSVHDLPDF